MGQIEVWDDTEFRLRQLADKYDTTVANIVDIILDEMDNAYQSWEEDLKP